ncbi:quinolinate synthase NadA [Pelagibius sp. Alg239-R121]|uniref:quinolinate synthase NadA n=1 Tax=Pelagibius sp. Alg239-R121 TaxID=2993448 RepID=UPI0024A681A0|nr:quinolinate synthase NadA [Pelagibius sp. Alg239-R121]
MTTALSSQATAATAPAPLDSAALYERVKRVIPPMEWPQHAGLVADVLKLKRERNAVVLAHNYQTPEIYHCVSDIVGDSLALARRATESDAEVIVMAGVHFMAETVKLLNPEKTVLIPDAKAGCSLATAITGADVERLRTAHPGVPVVTYVNTTAEVKAAADICCTSGNAVKIVESLGCDEVIFIPDEYLASYVARQTKVKVISWHGHCEVHERFTGEEIQRYRENLDDVVIVAHPECPPDVLDASDFVGSTAEMISYVKREQPKRVVMLTECSMSDNVAAEVPEVEFTRPCNLCPHMKRITLDNIRQALLTLEPRVEVPEAIAEKARASVQRMLAVR